MTSNSSIDPITELRRLQLEIAEMNDVSNNSPQLSNSRGSMTTELLRELRTVRRENAEFKKAQGAINRSILEDIGAIRKEMADFKSQSNEFRKMNQSILEKLEAIQKGMAGPNTSRDSAEKENQIPERPIVEEIIGTWKYVEEASSLKTYKYRKFFWRGDVIIESLSDALTSFPCGYEIDISRHLVNNQFCQGQRQLYIQNSKLHIFLPPSFTAVYEKIIV